MTSVYSAGTASVSNGSVTVIGTGTAWAITLVTGGMFSFAGMSVPIASVESDTSLTLAYAWPGATASGGYAIARETSEAVRAEWTNDRMATLIQRLSLVGIHPDGSGTLAERNALSPVPLTGFWWLYAEPGHDLAFYRKSASGWDGPYDERGPVGPAGALNWVEAGWAAATAYAVNNGLTRNGTSYRCYVAHTSAAATEPGVGVNWATVWKVTSAKGDAGPAIGGVLTTRGDLAVQGAVAVQRLARGAAGTVLKSNGTDPVWAASREVLTAARTYYVRTDGSDVVNDGLANTSGGAFLTILKACNAIKVLDLNGFSATVVVGAGTFAAPALPSIVGGDAFINGAGATTVLTGFLNADGIVGKWTTSNVKFQSSAFTAVFARQAVLYFGAGIEFGVCTGYHMQAAADGYIQLANGYTISGGATVHMRADGGTVFCEGVTITLTGTPAFSTAFVAGLSGGKAALGGNIYSGSATGVRYNIAENSIIRTYGAGASYLPGNVAGTAASGGVYDALIGGVREVLTANRTYYVRTDGSDSNTGLTDTSGGAFLTIAKALAVAAALDGSTFNVTVQVGAGTWTVPVVLPQFIGSGIWTLQGDPATPSNVLINVTGSCIAVAAINSVWLVSGFKLQSTLYGLSLDVGASLRYGNIDFGACTTAHVRTTGRAFATAFGNTTISGSALIHWFLSGASTITDAGKTITITGTPAFGNSFVQCDNNSLALVNQNTFVGSATGKRYTVGTNSVVNVNGGGATYLPGDVAGTTATGGQYV